MATKFDIRQSETRVLQNQLNSAAVTGMDSTLASINSELTTPGRLIASVTPNLLINISSGDIVNPNTSKNRVLAPINNVVASFPGGTITFPSTSGTITVSPGTNNTITIGANQYAAVLIQLNSSGQLSVLVGVPAASPSLAVVPAGVSSSLSLGYVIVQTDGSSIIQNVTNSMLYQFVGGGGSGGGGVGSGNKNYLTSLIASTSSGTANPGNGNFETGSTSGWTLAHSALTSLLPTSVATAGNAFSSTSGGSAASANLSLATIAAGSQIDGSYSGSLTSSAASVAGDMVISNSFFIDASDQSNVLGFNFTYKAVSGTLNFSGSSANSFAVYIYDVTNAVWIQPSGVYNLVQGSGVGSCSGSFQTSFNGTRYQIALININATAGAYNVYVDDFFVGPQTVVYGFNTLSPGYAGFLQDYAGGVIPDGWALADGGAISRTQYPDLFVNTGSGTIWGAGDGTTTFNKPNFTRRIAMGSGGTGTSTIGNTLGDTGGEEKHQLLEAELALHKHYLVSNAAVNSVPTNTTQMAVNQAFGQIQNNNTAAQLTLSSEQTSGQGNNPHNNIQPSVIVTKLVKLYNDIKVQVSSSTDTRVTALSITGTPTSALTTTNSVMIWGASSIEKDSNNAYNPSTGIYTIPVSGWYSMDVAYQFRPNSPIAGDNYNLLFYKNGGQLANRIFSFVNAPGNFLQAISLSHTGYFNAGDTVNAASFYTSSSATSGYDLSFGSNFLSIRRLSGPATIAASETVAAKVNTCGTSFTSLATVSALFTVKEFDTHGAYNTSTGIFTCPISGFYEVSSLISSSTPTGVSAGSINRIGIRKNGSSSSTMGMQISAVSTPALPHALFGTSTVQCNAGDTLQVEIANAESTFSGDNNVRDTWASFSRVK